jgi:CO/xanthine dehydrogenase Mo-binding subunit
MVTAVGCSVPRRDGASEVTGDARYTDDLVVAAHGTLLFQDIDNLLAGGASSQTDALARR